MSPMFDEDEIVDVNAEVYAVDKLDPGRGNRLPKATIWHAVYNLEERSMRIKFWPYGYGGDSPWHESKLE